MNLLAELPVSSRLKKKQHEESKSKMHSAFSSVMLSTNPIMEILVLAVKCLTVFTSKLLSIAASCLSLFQSFFTEHS